MARFLSSDQFRDRSANGLPTIEPASAGALAPANDQANQPEDKKDGSNNPQDVNSKAESNKYGNQNQRKQNQHE
jgi:hypothetical protein